MQDTPSFEVPIGRGKSVAFLATDFPEARKALDACSDNLMEKYGVPIDELRHAVVRPEPNRPGSWFKSDAYPPAAMRYGQEGRSVALVSLSAEGKATACRIVGTDTKQYLFGKATCEALMRNADYNPARNAAGEAIRTWTMFTVHFQMPT